MSLQDILSSVKNALSSDTAKGIGKGLAVTAGVGLLGGPQGIAAANQGIDAYRARIKERDTEKVSKVKQQLSEDILRAELKDKELKNRATIGKIGATKAADTVFKKLGAGQKTSKTASDKPKEIKVSNIPASSTNPSLVTDPEELQKNINTAIGTGRKDATKSAKDIAGIGMDNWKGVRQKVANELKQENLNPYQEQGMWQEYGEQAAPGAREKFMAMTGEEPKFTNQEELAMVSPGIVGAIPGAIAGFKTGAGIGSFGGPTGTMIGGAIGTVAGALAGYQGGNALAEGYDVSRRNMPPQADIGSTDQSNKILSNILPMLRPGEFLNVSQQLNSLPDFIALSDQEKSYVLSKIQEAIGGPRYSSGSMQSSGGLFGTANL